MGGKLIVFHSSFKGHLWFRLCMFGQAIAKPAIKCSRIDKNLEKLATKVYQTIQARSVNWIRKASRNLSAESGSGRRSSWRIWPFGLLKKVLLRLSGGPVLPLDEVQHSNPISLLGKKLVWFVQRIRSCLWYSSSVGRCFAIRFIHSATSWNKCIIFTSSPAFVLLVAGHYVVQLLSVDNLNQVTENKV